MTEQQILDKTIEYLNKYSNCIKDWKCHGNVITGHLEYKGENLKYATLIDLNFHNIDDYILTVREEVGSGKSIQQNRNAHFISEFHIAYNIIKDLSGE